MKDFERLDSACFTMDDQRRFAAASGDTNPMHMDALAARRTQAGVPVVHGINVLCWALDRLLAEVPDAPLGNISVKFEKFVEVGQTVALHVKQGAAAVRLEIHGDGGRLIAVTLRPSAKAAPAASGRAIPNDGATDTVPREPDWDGAAAASGTIAVHGTEGLYPLLAGRIGAQRLAAIFKLSYLVGMIVPGRHSIFSGLDISLTDDAAPAGQGLTYDVTSAHDIFRLLEIAIAAPGLHGTVEAFVRTPPVAQPSVATLRSQVAPQAFAHLSALVVGGSRGLGEVTAKLLAAGGARVAISYAVGKAEAEAVAADIATVQGDCPIVQIDARAPVAPQLAALPFAPNSLFYFATTRIFLQKSDEFSAPAFDEFRRIYIDAFAELCTALAPASTDGLLAFYPSSVAVAERPRGMTEYAMAKAAGEILCADLDRFTPGVSTYVHRLPRVETDQTATVTPVKSVTATEVMLEVLEAMTARAR